MNTDAWILAEMEWLEEKYNFNPDRQERFTVPESFITEVKRNNFLSFKSLFEVYSDDEFVTGVLVYQKTKFYIYSFVTWNDPNDSVTCVPCYFDELKLCSVP